MTMPRIPSPVSKIWARVSLAVSGIFLMGLSYGSLSNGQPFDGLVLLCAGGIVLLIGVIYAADWYENIDYGLRIIESIFGAALVGGILGLVIYGPKESIGGALLVGFAAEIAGVFCAFYLYYRDKRETSKERA
jgi:uncharacterized membrane protein YsdA (DUF1294 family)